MIAPFIEILDFKLNDKYLLLSRIVSDLLQKFTIEQVKKLHEVGVFSIYDLITYLPYDLQEIVPLELDSDFTTTPNKEFLWQGKLLNIDFRSGQKRFLVLQFQGNISLRCYLFSVTNYTLKNLEINQSYQLILKYNKGFWAIVRFAKSQELITKPFFLLGSAINKNYLLPKYNKLGYLQSNYFNLLHRRLKASDYHLNLEGLIPKNNFIQPTIDLAQIHKPQSNLLYKQTFAQWLSLKVFLKLSLVRYLESLNKKINVKTGNLNVTMLRELSSDLPFTLSDTQKKVIWEILQEITTSV